MWRDGQGHPSLPSSHSPLPSQSLSFLIGLVAGIFGGLVGVGGGVIVVPLMVRVALPGCQTAQELAAVKEAGARAGWQEHFTGLLTAALNAAARFPQLKAAAEPLQAFAAETLDVQWPSPVTRKWALEIWAPAPADTADGPVLCWSVGRKPKEGRA
jgi:hypothetical protein